MNTAGGQQTDTGSKPEALALVPPGLILFIMRFLAGLGLVGAGFLLFTHIAAKVEAIRATVPFCSALSWLDCNTVLNSRYADVFWIPVSGLGFVVYGLVLVALIRLNCKRTDSQLRLIWWFCSVGAVTITISVLWFMYLQIFVIGRICSYCTADHIVGLLLSVMLLIQGWRVCRRLGNGAVVIGIVLSGVLIVGQMFAPVRYTEPVIWTTDQEDRWVDAGAEKNGTEFLAGSVVINPEAHPVIGFTGGPKYIIEVVDLTCHRCRKLNKLLGEVRPRLNPDVAYIVVFFPLNSDCNPKIQNTLEYYVNSCVLTRLAYGVWLAEPERFAEFFYWLYENQQDITLDQATEYAQKLVGRAELKRAMADKRIDQLIKRDIELGGRLVGAKGLPGLIVGDYRFVALPETGDELEKMIRYHLSR